MEDLKALRRRMISKRAALAREEQERLSRQICAQIEALDCYKKAETVMIYSAVRGEADLRYLGGSGKRLVYPLCAAEGKMLALWPKDEAAFRQGAYSIPEPDPLRSREIAPEELDLVICPCTAFDEQGRRLGMGGGYYDRFLPGCTRAVILAAAYEFQKVAELDAQPWDVSMDMVVTETEVYRRGK